MRNVISLFRKLFKHSQTNSPRVYTGHHIPTIIPRSNHNISRERISKAALKVLYRLHKSGFSGYLVGGGVRDLLLGYTPKDFDVVTDAHPEQIQKLFRNSYIIGRRFRLVHVRFGSEIIEVATFRGHSDDNFGRVQTEEGLLLRDNVYGTLEDDVWRRDFTVNALYYNIADFSVVDFTEGMIDLQKKSIRVIGDPELRYSEDPARMLRAVRLAGKLGFTIEENSAEPIPRLRELLLQVPQARLFDKMLKIFHSGKSYATYQLMCEYNLFSVLFPDVAQVITDPQAKLFVEVAFKNTDERINADKSINSAFLFSVLLWGPLQRQKKIYLEQEEMKEYPALNLAMSNVIQRQLEYISIPRKFTTIVREIWTLQYFLENTKSRRVYTLFHHPRFRAAYHFLGLRSEGGEAGLSDPYNWWTRFQEADEGEREALIQARFRKLKKRKRKKKRDVNDADIHSTGK